MNVKVGGKSFEVEFVDNWEKDGENSDGAMGQVFQRELKIKINSNWDKWNKETLLHEIVHVISDDRGLKLAEKQVEQFTNGLYQVMKDNPQVMLYIMGMGMIK